MRKKLNDTWGRVRPQRYANGGAISKRDGVPLVLALFVLGMAWVAHDLLSIPLPSEETLEFVQHLVALLGFPAGVYYARRFKP